MHACGRINISKLHFLEKKNPSAVACRKFSPIFQIFDEICRQKNWVCISSTFSGVRAKSYLRPFLYLDLPTLLPPFTSNFWPNFTSTKNLLYVSTNKKSTFEKMSKYRFRCNRSEVQKRSNWCEGNKIFLKFSKILCPISIIQKVHIFPEHTIIQILMQRCEVTKHFICDNDEMPILEKL